MLLLRKGGFGDLQFDIEDGVYFGDKGVDDKSEVGITTSEVVTL